MRKLVYILLCFPFFAQSQIDSLDTEDVDVEYIFFEGDTIPHTAINLNEVLLLHKLKFDSNEDRKRYLILRRKTIKVYPYAKLAAERLETLNERMASIKKKSDQKKYAKIIQSYIEDEFAEELKQLTRTEGQILVKLIYRQTGETTFDLIKRLRSGWRAFWFNSTANLFNISLKEIYDPEHVKEDYLIEDVLQRNFQSGKLERQDAAIKFDFLELTEKWLN
ncbi:MAG: hypothetical protein CMP05_13035 [Xanthomarina sp.]|uniref:DUF4294 domain-containing protein n=1 Tax=Xanthomarina TaxID=1868329 RepID=UPI000C68CE20|nr:DUF4294 domain-containing protein [Xanthomarina sp.]MAL21691.1 hypothetical protein [Xanthomarina sp.]MBF62906.1 hypothetical protein [Xanthomarina sp.]HAB27548.1 DUF4294 domain-containing protein [Xanthomarina gelatinilytica]HAI19494.1 DUF4294 domain-containing protein [Xanthomarina gelatinilytica]